jgi:predicted enzyme involved in methoxymalonyl-ACP biosynthesis
VELLAATELQDKLKAGQRGLVIFPVEQRSLGMHWYLSACRWIEKKIETAVQSSSN